MALITLKSFNNVMDAHMAKAKLELAGIECYLFDEHTASVNPLYLPGMGGVRLKIDDLQFDEADAILNADAKEPFTDETDQLITCPNCHSSQLSSHTSYIRKPLSIISWITAFLTIVMPFHGTYVYHCSKCGHEFEPKKRDF